MTVSMVSLRPSSRRRDLAAAVAAACALVTPAAFAQDPSSSSELVVQGTLDQRNALYAQASGGAHLKFEGNPPNPPEMETHTSAVPPTGAIVTGAIGLVGLGLGIGFGVASGAANSDNLTRGSTAGGVCSTNPTAQVCLDGKATRDTQQTDAILSTVGYVVGGVALATAVVWWIVAPRKIVERKAMIVPSVGPHSAGASFNFTF